MVIEIRTNTMGKHRKRNFILCLTGIILILHIIDLYSQHVQLTWEQNNSINISHYNIYRKTGEETAFTLLNSVSYPDTSYIENDLPCLACLKYAITAVNYDGIESGFSNIIELSLSTSTPVEWSNFSGYSDANKNILEWTTATESNNYGFEIQRSSDSNSNFKKIGFVEDMVHQQFQFIIIL